jgi:hypothetical protein
LTSHLLTDEQQTGSVDMPVKANVLLRQGRLHGVLGIHVAHCDLDGNWLIISLQAVNTHCYDC